MLTIRRASPDDAEEICTLHKASIRQLCSSAYAPEQITAWIKPITPDRYLLAMQQFEFFVAVNYGIIGFFILNLKDAEMNAVYLHPNAVGHGVGRRLFKYAEGLAQNKSVSELKLKSTLNAVGFYEACGFRRVRDSVHTNPAGVELPCVEMTKIMNTN